MGSLFKAGALCHRVAAAWGIGNIEYKWVLVGYRTGLVLGTCQNGISKALPDRANWAER